MGIRIGHRGLAVIKRSCFHCGCHGEGSAKVQRRCGHARYPLLVIHRIPSHFSSRRARLRDGGSSGCRPSPQVGLACGEAAADSGSWCAASAVTLAAVTGSVAATTIALATVTLVATTGATAGPC